MNYSRRDPIIRPVPIDELRPTQMTVGLREVERKRQSWRAKDDDGRQTALETHMVPIVLGPGGERYITDHHHLTRALFEDGRLNRVMTRPIDTHCPIHILQGMADPDVPASHALRLASHLPADDLTVSLIPGGDHRLSRPQDLEMLLGAVETMIRHAA